MAALAPPGIPTYPNNIPSVRDMCGNLNLPQILNDIDLTKTINAGDQVDMDDLLHATRVVGALKSAKESGPSRVANANIVTDEVIAVAQMRVRAIETTHMVGRLPLGDVVGLLQEINQQLGVMGGRLDGIEGRLDGIEGRLGDVEGRLDAVEGRLGGVEGRLGGVEGRLGAVEGRLGGVEGRLGGIEGRLDGEEGLGAIGQRLAVMEGVVTLTAARVENQWRSSRNAHKAD